MSLEREEDYVCSLSWTKEGTYLAIGTSDCKIQVRVNRWTFHLFSVLNDTWQRSALFLFSKWHIFVSLVVGCLQPEASAQHVQSYVKGCKPQLEWPRSLQVKFPFWWSDNIFPVAFSSVFDSNWNVSPLSSGSRSGHIHHHDVRVADHHIFTLTGHSQEVCGLQWSPDGRYLASGGNDNMVYVWPRVQEGTASQSVRSWSEHQGAVKVSGRHEFLFTDCCTLLFTVITDWCACRSRLWPGVHGSQTSWHLEVAPVTATSASGM